MPTADLTAASSTSLRMLALLLDALGPHRRSAERAAFCGLPTPTIVVPPCRLLVSATPCAAPAFANALVAASLLSRHDALLVRHGLHPEILDPVCVDAAVTTAGRTSIHAGLLPFLDDGHGLWLIPAAARRTPSIRLTERGIRTERRAPFGDADDRHAGLIRAARAILLRNRPT